MGTYPPPSPQKPAGRRRSLLPVRRRSGDRDGARYGWSRRKLMETRRLGRLEHMTSVLVYGGASLSEVPEAVADR